MTTTQIDVVLDAMLTLIKIGGCIVFVAIIAVGTFAVQKEGALDADNEWPGGQRPQRWPRRGAGNE